MESRIRKFLKGHDVIFNQNSYHSSTTLNHLKIQLRKMEYPEREFNEHILKET